MELDFESNVDERGINELIFRTVFLRQIGRQSSGQVDVEADTVGHAEGF